MLSNRYLYLGISDRAVQDLYGFLGTRTHAQNFRHVPFTPRRFTQIGLHKKHLTGKDSHTIFSLYR